MASDVTEAAALCRAGHRSERVVLVLTGAGAVLCAAIAFWPVPDYREEYRRLGETEQRAITARQAILADAQAGRASETEIANRIEREVLPVWRDAVRQASEIPEGAVGIPMGVSQVFRARQEAWEAMVAAARSADPNLSQEAGRRWAAANEAAARLRAKPGPPAR